MSFKVHFPQLAFQRVDPLNPVVPIGEPVVVKKGENVPDWATPSTVAALTHAGMIIAVADDPVVEIVEPIAPALGNPEVPPHLGGPATMETVFSSDPAPVPTYESDTEVVQDPDAEPLVRPRAGDNKAMWEAYAESVGIDRAEAESLSKAALQERVAEREREQGQPTGLL